jgi:2'-5' RNA ligase
VSAVAALEAMVRAEPGAGSALLFVVPEVDELVGGYRRRYTADGAVVPPHITLLHPCFAPAAVTPALLRRVARVVAAVPAFGFSLAGVARFPGGGVLYLAPEPAAPFVALITRLRRAFPEIPTYWDAYDGVVPHLTVADLALADRPDLGDAVAAALAPHLPVRCAAREAVLLQRVRPFPAPWVVGARFPLAPSGEPPDARERPGSTAI